MKPHFHRKQATSLEAPLKALALTTLAAIALSPASSAQRLMVGGPDTLIRRAIPVTPDFDVVGACGGIVESMATHGEKTFIGDSSGVIYVHDPVVGLNYAFNGGNDAAALATDSTYLYVGGSDGTIERYSLASYAPHGAWMAPAGLRALATSADQLFAAGDNGEVVSTNLFGSAAGTFNVFADGGMPIAAITVGQDHMHLGSASGIVQRLDMGTGLATETFSVGTDIAALEMSLAQLLVAGSEGIVRRVNPVDGTLLQELSVGSSIRGIAITAGSSPAFSYCYGFQCPCGNNDPTAGCANSTGSGARMAAAGSASVSADDLTLFVTSAPAHTTMIVFMGSQGSASPPLGDGILCIGAAAGLQRFGVQQTNAFGTLVLGGLRQTSIAQFGPQFQITVGSSWKFQAWFRDNAGPCGSASNTTNNADVHFTL